MSAKRAHRSVWGFMSEVSPVSHGWGSWWESLIQLVGSAFLYCPLRVLSATLSASFLSLLIQLRTQYSIYGEKEPGLHGNRPQAWGSLVLSPIHSLDPMGERSQVRKISLGTELCPFLIRRNTGEVKLFLLLSLMHLNAYFFFFLISNVGLELLHWKPGLLQSFSHPWVIV